MKRTPLPILSLALAAVLYNPAMASDDPSFESQLFHGRKAIVSMSASSPISAALVSGKAKNPFCSNTRCQILGFNLVCSGNGVEITTSIENSCLTSRMMPVDVKVDRETFHFALPCDSGSYIDSFKTKKGNSYMLITGVCSLAGPYMLEVKPKDDWDSHTRTCLPILCQP